MRRAPRTDACGARVPGCSPKECSGTYPANARWRVDGSTHAQLANFIWSVCHLLRGPYKWNEYPKVILPLTVLRRFDSLLAPTKKGVLQQEARGKQLTFDDMLANSPFGVDWKQRKRDRIKKLNEKRTALVSQIVTRGLPPEGASTAGLKPYPKLKRSGVKWTPLANTAC